jgi:GNAT superfamily N-acetyltransferase
VAELRSYRVEDLPALAEAWNDCFADEPNFVRVDDSDLRRCAFGEASFDPSGVLVATAGSEPVGFVHCGPRMGLWPEPGKRGAECEEGQIRALVARESDGSVVRELLEAAEARLREAGARRFLIGPSWVQGAQFSYNGIAGAYEIPGASPTREALMAAARESGYEVAAEYGTPEVDFSDQEHLALLESMARDLRERARKRGMERRLGIVESRYFPRRMLVELHRGREVVATTAYGPWAEYVREYGRRLYGLTSVQVSPGWRGGGLGKLIVIEAMMAARDEGAEGAHLHVWRGNEPAWNLYHRALGFRPKCSWVTLEKQAG